MQGRIVSPAHRQAIAAGQRRRHARRRVLVAIEALHHELTAVDDGCDSKASAADAAAAALRQLKSSSAARPSITSDVSHEGNSPVAAHGGLDDVHRDYAMRLRCFRRCDPGFHVIIWTRCR